MDNDNQIIAPPAPQQLMIHAVLCNLFPTLSLCYFLCRFNPDGVSEVQSNTSDNTDLNGKYMHFLKDNECNNGSNHNVSSQGDCRAKAPIHISEAGPVQVGQCGLPFEAFHYL
jgi:hypothetical protein